MNESITKCNELWDQFLTLFPLEKLESMNLSDYSQVGSKDSFTWWIESGLDELGSIWGGSSFKFGIYARKDTEKNLNSKGYKGDSEHGWLSKYGSTSSEAFATVISLIAQVARAANEGDL